MRHISSRIQKALMVAGILCAVSIPALAKAPQGDIQVKPMHPFFATFQECVLSFQDYLKTETHLENGVEVTVMHLHADPSRKSFHSPQQVSLLDDGSPSCASRRLVENGQTIRPIQSYCRSPFLDGCSFAVDHKSSQNNRGETYGTEDLWPAGTHSRNRKAG